MDAADKDRVSFDEHHRVRLLCEERAAARARGDFGRSDEIRKTIASLGYVVEDVASLPGKGGKEWAFAAENGEKPYICKRIRQEASASKESSHHHVKQRRARAPDSFRKRLNKKKRKAQQDKKNRASCFANYLVRTFDLESSRSQVLDVAGGKGSLSYHLAVEMGIPSTIVDPAPCKFSPRKTAKILIKATRIEILQAERLPQEALQADCFHYKTAEKISVRLSMPCANLISKGLQYLHHVKLHQIRGLFDASFSSRHHDLWARCTCVAGLHPDSATDDICFNAAAARKPFAVVPCCVFPSMNKHRKIEGTGAVVTTTEEYVNWLHANCNHAGVVATVATLDFGGRNKVLSCKHSSCRLIAFGNAMIDATVEVDSESELRERFHVATGGETTIFDPEFRRASVNWVLNQKDVVLGAGGSALNTAQCVAALLPPESAYFLGAVGRDSKAKRIRDACLKSGLIPLLKEMTNEEVPFGTGVCAVLVEKSTKERSLVCFRGASVGMDAEYLDSPEAAHALRADYCIHYITAFTLSTSNRYEVAETLCTFRLAQDVNRIVALNLSSAVIQERVKNQVAKLLPFVDIIFCNAGELEAWGRAHCRDTENSGIAVLTYLSARLKKGSRCAVIVTDSSKPVLVALRTHESVKIISCHVPPVTSIVDTNGAGDAFVGGFLSEMILSGIAVKGMASLSEDAIVSCCKRGIACASKTLGTMGFCVDAFLQ